MNRLVVSSFCATSSHSYLAPNPTEFTLPIPPMSLSSPLVACTDYFPVQKPIKTYTHCLKQLPKYFQIQSSQLHLAVLRKMLVEENLGVSAFKIILQSVKQGNLY